MACNNFDDPELRNEFHDAMHIAALAHEPSSRAEALTGVVEQTLLREPYNGNTNHQLEEASRSKARIMRMVVGTRRFNPAGHEDFERPAPVANLASAIALGKERLDFTTQQHRSNETVSDEDMEEAYNRAVAVDNFFKGLMGGRAVYQLSSKELLDMPVAFFGLQKTGDDNELQFTEIPQETREEILALVGEQNTILHTIENAKTVEDLSCFRS